MQPAASRASGLSPSEKMTMSATSRPLDQYPAEARPAYLQASTHTSVTHVSDNHGASHLQQPHWFWHDYRATVVAVMGSANRFLLIQQPMCKVLLVPLDNGTNSLLTSKMQVTHRVVMSTVHTLMALVNCVGTFMSVSSSAREAINKSARSHTTQLHARSACAQIWWVTGQVLILWCCQGRV